MIIPNREEIVVVCGADDKYAMPLAVTIRSSIEHLNSSCQIKLFVIDAGIKRKNRENLEKLLDLKRCSIEWILAPKKINELPILERTPNISAAAYCRLFMAEILPKNYKKAIYLDSDVIVNEDLGQLWKIPIEENYLLAVQDMEIPFISSPYGISKYKELELQANCKYFNSGILVINLEKWRTEAIALKAMKYLVQNKDYLHHHDQESLNVVIAGKWGELDPRWNQQTKLYKYSVWQDSPFAQDVYNNLLHHPYIIHFTGISKPWNSYTHPFNSLFFQYVDMTPWSGWRFTVWQFLLAKLSWKVKQLKKRVLRKKIGMHSA